MHYLGFLIASVFSCKVIGQAPPIERIVTDYFNSQSVRAFRSAWEVYKKPMEHAIKTALLKCQEVSLSEKNDANCTFQSVDLYGEECARNSMDTLFNRVLQLQISLLHVSCRYHALAETVGLPGMNVFIRKTKEKLAVGYVHDDHQVQVIVQDLYLKSMPRCRLPDLYFSLASNVLKIETKLSEMIIHANYSLLRNQKDIIHETAQQDPFKNSPFLYVQVEDAGKVAIRVDGCTLSGFIITTLTGESVNLGYDYFKLSDCVYTIEIYKANSNSMPVIAKYNLDIEEDTALSLTDLLLRPLLTEELIPKMQAAVFSFVNASAIFGSKFTEYRDNQEIVFQTTAQYMTELIRNLNRITVEKNEGVIDMEDFTMLHDEENLNGIVKLTGMVLYGLNTMYSAHSGGPIKTDKVMIAEEIRFSSLQVRGTLQVTSKGADDSFVFATEITDLVVDVHLEEEHWNKGFKLIEVKGLRRMAFSLSTLTHATAESMIGGYLLNEVPKLVHDHLTDIFRDAVHPNRV